MLKSLSLIAGLSILIHGAISYFKHLDNQRVVDKIDAISESDQYAFGYAEGYHRATEDLADLNSTPEIH